MIAKRPPVRERYEGTVRKSSMVVSVSVLAQIIFIVISVAMKGSV